jgi:hypothetical protein
MALFHWDFIWNYKYKVDIYFYLEKHGMDDINLYLYKFDLALAILIS